jgi:hypothetical protein
MAKFESGKSGNPAGRPTGRPDRRTELRRLLEPHATKLIETVVAKALAGDMAAMRMCIDRLCPTLKPASEPLTLDATGTLSDQAAAVFAAVVAGEISTEEAAALAGILANTARTQESDKKIHQFDELKKLIEALSR